MPVLIAAAAAAPRAAAQERPPFDAQETMQAVAALLERRHVSRMPLGDEISHRAFRALLTSLDPLGLYFLQADVKALSEHEDLLDDDMREGDDSFARHVHDLYEQRVAESVQRALKWLDRPHDFSIDESMELDVGLEGIAATPEQLDDRWRKRVKYDLLILEGDGTTGQEARDKLKRRYERMAERIATRRIEDIDSVLLEAMASSYDPHTGYLPPRAAENFEIHMRTNYEGIGAVLGDDEGRTVISRIMPGGAAAKSGLLRVKDVIHGVGQGEDGEIRSVEGMELDDVVDLIRGPRGTKVRLKVTTGAEKPRIVVIERARTELVEERASSRVVEQDGARIGWIDLPGFYADPRGEHSATRDVASVLEGWRGEHIDCVVLDLRLNGGGLLSEAVGVAGLFLDSGNVVQVRGSGDRIDRLDDEDEGMAWAGPLVVLTSRFSASASEIVAGAIKDHGRGLLVGDHTTHGKGTVQSLIDLSRFRGPRGEGPSGALKITVQQFFRPGGDSTQLRGVLSDIVLPSYSEVLAEGEESLPNALPFSTLAAIVDPSAHPIARDLVQRLAEASKARVAKDEWFQKVVAENDARSDWLRRKVVPLERGRFQAWRGTKSQRELGPDGLPKAEDAAYVAEVCRIAKGLAEGLRLARAK
ncbi:MAG: carboxy terminal-processing peptidase [Planctomycetota bacterium]